MAEAGVKLANSKCKFSDMDVILRRSRRIWCGETGSEQCNPSPDPERSEG